MVRGNLEGLEYKVADREERGVSKGFGHQRAVETTGREEAVIPQIRSVEVFDDLRHVKELADLEHPHLPCRFYVADMRPDRMPGRRRDRKSTRLNSSH